MSDKYNNPYSDDNDNVYGHVVDVIKNLRLKDEGVHLDIACGYGAIHSGLKKHKYKFEYIGIDTDKESVQYLKKLGVESYEYKFTCDESDYTYVEEVLKGRKITLVTVLDFLEHLPQPEKFLKIISRICKKYQAILIISVPNVCHKDIVLKMMEGEFNYTDTGLLDKTHLSFFSEKRLEECLSNADFQQVYCNDLKLEKSDQHFPIESSFLSKGTSVHQYLEHLKKLVDPFATVNQFIRAYVPVKKIAKMFMYNEVKKSKPFLSIITRTQGKRIESLTETLLCLTGQKNTDFEIIIIGHKLDIDCQKNVERVIEELPEWLRKKVRLIRVDYGNRTTPLNVGFQEAIGEYISILDDDDIVFDNWVDEFYKLSKKAPGAILHSYAVLQEWEVIKYDDGEALRAAGTPKDIYCKDFNLLKQLAHNSCPTLSCAFPSYAFQKLGIRFNERLTTVEDWDFFMRTAFITSVAESHVVTCIYRLWTNAENSLSLHNKREWQHNENFIRYEFNKTPIVLPAGYAAQIQDHLMHINDIKGHDNDIDHSYNFQEALLFVDYGYGFNNSDVIYCTEYLSNLFIFNKFSEGEKVSCIRFDPCEDGMLWLSDIYVEVFTVNRKSFKYRLKELQSNGLKMKNGILFLKSDPQVILNFEHPMIVERVKIYCSVEKNIPSYLLDNIYKSYLDQYGETKKSNKNFEQGTLYIDYGYGFQQSDIASCSNYKLNLWEFEKFSTNKEVKAIRFDPTENGMIWIFDIYVEIFTTTGKIITCELNDMSSNGIKINNGILFLKSDPQVIILFEKSIIIKKVKINCKVHSNIPDNVFDKVIRRFNTQ